MLQRAASNAYSWWWASHVRTKQSKWLEQNLQDMEEKVQIVLKLIEEDGDSFRKRAEMYYKKRPELIHFVEESYRAYRALAERYDHISTELQNANNTLAYVFPEQVELAMEDDEDEAPPRFPKKTTTESSTVSIPKVPKVPKDLKGLFSSAPKKLQPKDQMPAETPAKTSVSKSGLSKSQGLGEIDKIQKQILGLQTEKEFARSSYEGGLTKYWEIENQIRELQDRVCTLQDEFGAGAVIEDVEARTLMATAALKSCQETLSRLEDKQKASAEEAVGERERIHKVRQKLKSLKNDITNSQIDQEKTQTGDGSMEAVEELESSDQEASSETQRRQDLELLRQTIKAQCEVGSNPSVSVTQLVEKIDALVIKVIDIEFLVSSQTALIQRLRTETDELLAQIRALEDDKAALIEGKKDMSNKLREMDERLQVIQHLNQNVEDQNNNLQTHFTEARCNLDHLSQRVHTAESDDQLKDIAQRKESTAVPYPEQLFKGKSDSQDPHNTLSGMQNIKPEKDLKVSGSQSEDAHNELLNIKSAEEYVASGSEFDDSDKKVQNDKLEELRVSDSLRDDSDEEVQNAKLELRVSDNLCDDTYKEAQNVKPDEEVKVSGSPLGDGQKEVHNIKPEEFEASGSQRDCDNKELQNMKPANQFEALDPSQQKVESLAEVSFSTELNEEEQKLNRSSVFEKASMEKPEGTKEDEDRSSDKNHSDDATLPQTTDDTQDSEEIKERLAKSTSSRELDVSLSETTDREKEQGDEPDWKKLFMKGIENREQILLAEYTSVLRNFKEVKKQLAESEKKKGDSLLDVMIQLKDLKSANEMKDEQIRYLKQKLSLLHAGLAEDNESNLSIATESSTVPVEKDINVILMDQPENMSEIERKFRMKIDEVLEENLDFWLRFSNTFHQIQKFESAVQDLQSEMIKLEEKRKQEESGSSKYYLKSDAKPLYRHLREINTELTVWLDKSMLLKDEVKSRFSSLSGIQEEITDALKGSAEDDDFKFTSYQAAKFQGEILNMKQENNKVEDELQAGLDHIAALQLDVEKSLTRLNDDFKLSESKQNIQLQHSESRSRVPLRSFIFGNKPKKQKYSILSCVHPSLQKKYNGFRAGKNQ